MGGTGSGRHAGGGKDLVERCRQIDVNRLHREGCLAPGWTGHWRWHRNGEQVGVIGLRSEGEALVLTYKVSIAGGDWEDIRERVPVEHVACTLGGTRPYFLCPGAVTGVPCGRRVAKLHAGGRYFLCRHCYRLAHASQREDGLDRALRRANRIRTSLGGAPGMLQPFPIKPRGMWQRTYDRLKHRALAAEVAADEAMAERLERLRA